MITVAWYLLKVIICSGILCGYYFLALRNKVFHRWNRFYLLATIVISLVVPVMKINIFSSGDDNGTVVRMLQTISYGDEAVVEISRHNSFQLTTENVTEAAYVLISAIFLFIFFLSLYRIERLKRKFPSTKFKDISFIETNAKGTPFSFFKNIFWNKAIDIHSTSGQQIFNHEIAHVKEKHSYDKIFMNIVLVLFWINPFFWLIRKELYMIHEFIADKEALEDSDINAFAEMILQTIYPGQNFSLANNFFYSPLKRRLLMLAKNKNPRVSYISRLLVLPLAAIVFFAFTLKVKNRNANLYDGKTITVVIDAGHGGDDNGAVSNDGIKEKDITLAIARKIAESNLNPHIQILLSRKDDYPLSVKDRVEFAKSNGADMFISLHVNAAADKQLNGFSVLIDKDNGMQNLLLGSALINELRKTYNTQDQLGARAKGVWVLDHNSCTTALVECGYLSNSSDEAFITNSANQDKIAKDVLEAINAYASSKKSVGSSDKTIMDNPAKINDSIPDKVYTKVQVEASFPGGLQAWSRYMSRVITQSIDSFTKRDYGTCVVRFIVNVDGSVNDVVATTMKGTELAKVSVNAIKNGPKWIPASENGKTVAAYRLQPVTLSNPDQKTNQTSSASSRINTKNDTGKVYIKVENEASFPGGLPAWSKYISRAITDSIEKFTQADYGTCVVRFIVNVDGSVSDVAATTMKGTELAKVSINAIKNGPKWIPASQNGQTVAAYRLQPITLTNRDSKPGATENEKNKNSSASNKSENSQEAIFAKLEKNATFPGGSSAWLKYITRTIQKNANELTADKNSEGVCKVRFIVNKDGKVSDVQAITKQDSKLADVAINAIENGPRWVPGMQNGHVVNSLVIQPVSFALNDKPGLRNEPQ